jgi:uncharacterized protein YdaU (DUF1376 family)
MSSKTNIWMPWYIDNYLADTLEFNVDEHGAYCVLLFKMWKNLGYLPADHEKLRKILKITKKKFEKIWSTVGEKFINVGDKITNVKLLKEFEKSIYNKSSYSKRGKKGSSKRWGNDSSAIPQPLAEDSPLPLPLPTEINKESGYTDRKQIPDPPAGEFLTKKIIRKTIENLKKI